MPDKLLDALKAATVRLGYRFERIETDTAIEERMIRPDGTVAVTATKPRQNT